MPLDLAVQDIGSPAEASRVVDYVNKVTRVGSDFNQLFHTEQKANYSLFRGETTRYIHVDRAAAWRSTVVPPEAFRAINVQVPRVVQGLFPHRQYFDFYSNDADRRYENLAKSSIHHCLRKMRFVKEAITGTQKCAVLGHMIGKVVYDYDLEDRVRDELEPLFDSVDGSVTGHNVVQNATPQVSYAGARFSHHTIFEVLQDPTGQGLWWVHLIPTTLEALVEVNRRFDKPVYVNLGLLQRSLGASRSVTPNTGVMGRRPATAIGLDAAHLDTISQLEGIDPTFMRSVVGTPILLKVFVGYVPEWIQRYGEGGQWRLVVVANEDIPLRDVPIPTHNRKPYFFNVPWIPMFGRLYGVSHLAYAAGIIDEITQLDRARMDEVLLSLHPHTIINQDLRWDNPNWVRQLGGIARVRGLGPDKPVANAAVRFDTKTNLQQVWAERAAKRNILDELFTSTPLFEGMPHSSRQTAEEISTLRNEGNVQFGLLSAWQNLCLKSEVIERTWGIIQRYMTDEQIIRITGEEDTAVIVSARDLQIDGDIVLDVGVFGPWGLAQAQVLAQSLQFMSAEPFAAWVRPREFFGDFLEHAGVPNADRYLFTTEQMEARQRETFDQQLQLLKLQAANGGGGGGAPAQ